LTNFRDFFFNFISGWVAQWNNFLKYLTLPDASTGRRWIDPAMLRRWFQGIVDKSNIKNLTDYNVTRVITIIFYEACTSRVDFTKICALSKRLPVHGVWQKLCDSI
jgi:hypothetical protein